VCVHLRDCVNLALLLATGVTWVKRAGGGQGRAKGFYRKLHIFQREDMDVQNFSFVPKFAKMWGVQSQLSYFWTKFFDQEIFFQMI